MYIKGELKHCVRILQIPASNLGDRAGQLEGHHCLHPLPVLAVRLLHHPPPGVRAVPPFSPSGQ